MTDGIFGTSLFLPKLFEAKIQVRKESEIFSLVMIKFWLKSFFLRSNLICLSKNVFFIGAKYDGVQFALII